MLPADQDLAKSTLIGRSPAPRGPGLPHQFVLKSRQGWQARGANVSLGPHRQIAR